MMTRRTYFPSYPFMVVGILLLSAMMSPAFASGGIYCFNEDETVNIDISMGRVPIYAPLDASARYGDKWWSTQPRDDEIKLGPSQGFLEDGKLSVDFTDDQVSEIIMSLRIKTTEDENAGSEYFGTLTFKDGIAHQVSCMAE